MLTAFTRAFRTPDLRSKLLFTLGVMGLFRLGSLIPTPGVDYAAVQECLNKTQDSSGLFALVNLFSGGALLQLSIFALGIMPYITASIIVQLLTVVIPRFEALKKEGQAGQTKMTQYTRYLTIALAILQSTAILAAAKNQRLIGECRVLFQSVDIFEIVIMAIVMTAGTSLIMWLGELITDRGIGNGMSLLIFTSIASGFPGSLLNIKKTSQYGDGWPAFFAVIGVGFLIVAAVVFVEQAQRRVPVQYAKRMIGRRMYGGSSTYIPLKVNQAGVIPVIFASSLLYIPVLVANLTDQAKRPDWANFILNNFQNGTEPLYLAVYILFIIFFTFFYVGITFNPTEVADNMKKYGGFIPGIRAGTPTAEYLQYILTRLTWPGSFYLGLIALLPLAVLAAVSGLEGADGNSVANFPFGGTSILIIVGVGLETVKQIESQLQQRNYEGFLR